MTRAPTSRPALRAVAMAALAMAAAIALSGCSGKKAADEEVVLPGEITERDLQRLTDLASALPTRYDFPGTEDLQPLLGLFFNGTLAAGTAAAGIEVPNDDGPIDYGGAIVPFDLSGHVPAGQPVEVRANLKWWGDPGASADLDIWADMPGTNDALNPERFDESMNWNIINKQRVIDAVHVEGQPFQVGIQVNNGRIVHPDGVRYSLKVDLHFADGVLGPGVPYAIHVPPNSTGLVVKTERVTGDEHVDVSFLLIGPDDRLVRYVQHNDIGVDTLFFPVDQPGEHVVYAHHMHGGFIRLESEVPNPQHLARRLQATATDVVLHEGSPAPGTFAESGLGGNTWGAEGDFQVGPAFPLDVLPFIRSTAGAANAAVNVSAPGGWLATAFTCNHAFDDVPAYCVGHADEQGRIGASQQVRHDRSRLDVGAYRFGIVAGSPGITLGVTVLTYTR